MSLRAGLLLRRAPLRALGASTSLPRVPVPSSLAVRARLTSSPTTTPSSLANVRFASSSSSSSSAGAGAGAAEQPPIPPKAGKPGLAYRGVKISHLFGGIVSLGLLITIYGLLEWYFSLQIWPEPIKTPLKKALKARGQGDYDRADEFFREAVTAAQSVPPSALDPDPLRKLSGIYITWATMLEGNGQPVRAFVAYRDALGLFGPSPLAKDRAPANGWAEGHVLDDEDHLRAIGLAQKLGQIAVRMGSFPIPPPFPHAATDKLKSWDGAGEAYLSGALGAMLRLGLAGRAPPTPESGPVVIGRDVNLPEKEGDTEGRVNRRGLGMTMEALAEVYARQGQYALAGQLLIQAISTLVPPQDKNPSVADRCQAAMLMTTVSSHALEPRTPQAVRASRSWSLQSLQFIDSAAEAAGWKDGSAPGDTAAAVCAQARSVANYNLGMLDEMDGNKKDAARRFAEALAVARESGFSEGRREAGEALKRVRAALAAEKK